MSSSGGMAISVRGLGKTYPIRHEVAGGDAPTTLAEAVARRLRQPFRRLGGASRETLWALRDVSLDVRRGEVVGLIGHNGAGKSTLLKILSRITEPSAGEARVWGRVGSLLEVGSGFHQELTGRENIHLSGAILGMRRREIGRQFDAIVEFAGVERFLDTPVKRYSSGMYVRLAFAVAAHLRSEVLLVDEVLAVGDAAFQQRCLGKIREVAAGGGRTVVLVSHSAGAVMRLCRRAILLEAGRVAFDGDAARALERYAGAAGRRGRFEPERGRRSGDGRARIVGFDVEPASPRTGEAVRFGLDVVREDGDGRTLAAELAVAIRGAHGERLVHLFSRNAGEEVPLRRGMNRVEVRVEKLPLVAGEYRVNLWLGSGGAAMDFLEDCFSLHVSAGAIDEGGKQFVEDRGYPVVLPARWHCEAISNREMELMSSRTERGG